MKKILFLLFVISFIGCDKDENKEIDEIDYSYFLALRTPSVRGVLTMKSSIGNMDGENFKWVADMALEMEFVQKLIL